LEEARDRLRTTIEGGVKQMLEQRIQACRDVLGRGNDKMVSFEVRAGKPAEEIINASEEKGYDLIVMGSSKIASPVRILGSTARRVLDSTKKPVLLIHE
jgi:nucleotide-binding universal stress UspA family protein